MRTVLLTASLVLALCGSAEARPGVTTNPASFLSKGTNVGRELFPSACEPNVVLEQLADDSLAAAGREPCTLWLFPAYFNAPRWQRCAVISHEYGHLAGLEHSDNFRSIMYPQVTRYNAPAACVRSRAGYGTVRYDGRR